MYKTTGRDQAAIDGRTKGADGQCYWIILWLVRWQHHIHETLLLATGISSAIYIVYVLFFMKLERRGNFVLIVEKSTLFYILINKAMSKHL
jgi:hypothetical protein